MNTPILFLNYVIHRGQALIVIEEDESLYTNDDNTRVDFNALALTLEQHLESRFPGVKISVIPLRGQTAGVGYRVIANVSDDVEQAIRDAFLDLFTSVDVINSVLKREEENLDYYAELDFKR
jgi:hypothetical protein